MITTKPSKFFFALFLFFYRILLKKIRYLKLIIALQKKITNNNNYQKYSNSLTDKLDLSHKTLIFDVEGALLKSSSLFPYFMLVAFEAGSVIRGFVMFLLYPLIYLVNEEMGLNIMVMVSFFGIKEETFRAGRAVLPKFLLDDVGFEVFEMLRKCKRKMGVSDLPQVMIENFLKDYLEIDCVVGRKMKVVNGFFVGVMEEKRKRLLALQEMLEEDEKISAFDDHVIGIAGFNISSDLQMFTHCKKIYLVRGEEKRSWKTLPRQNYPNPLIFHDGRLALKPTPLAILTIFMWLPFGLILSIVRAIVAITFPHSISIPILAFSGLNFVVTEPKTESSLNRTKPKKGLLYVCNHRTLLDPIYLAFKFKRNFTAVTYSLSRMSEIIAPIKTVRLTRNRNKDAKTMETLLSQGDLVVCPEGTTCREPYLLRFSPLFTELSEEIVPVAVNTHVTMFHGTTAGGLKCLDWFYFLLNPSPFYRIHVLPVVSGLSSSDHENEESQFEVANYVQEEIAKALGFECTKLTRRDKYLILAGNEGSSKH